MYRTTEPFTLSAGQESTLWDSLDRVVAVGASQASAYQVPIFPLPSLVLSQVLLYNLVVGRGSLPLYNLQAVYAVPVGVIDVHPQVGLDDDRLTVLYGTQQVHIGGLVYPGVSEVLIFLGGNGHQ